VHFLQLFLVALKPQRTLLPVKKRRLLVALKPQRTLLAEKRSLTTEVTTEVTTEAPIETIIGEETMIAEEMIMATPTIDGDLVVVKDETSTEEEDLVEVRQTLEEDLVEVRQTLGEDLVEVKEVLTEDLVEVRQTLGEDLVEVREVLTEAPAVEVAELLLSSCKIPSNCKGLSRFPGKDPLDGIGMTIEVEVADNAAQGPPLVELTNRHEVPRRAVSPMVETTIAEGQNLRAAAIMVGIAQWTSGRNLVSIHVASIFGVLFREVASLSVFELYILVEILSLAS
jgi:hypothetical protein